MNTPIRVLVVDDHPVFLAGLRGMIEDDPRAELVGEATDGDQALAVVAEARPDVIIMDLMMPGTNGIDATRLITEQHPQIRVLVLTMAADPASLSAAMRAGARGYALKGARPAELLAALHAVADGMFTFSPGVADRFTGSLDTSRSYAASAFPQLTNREQQILAALARQQTNPQIARALGLTEKTVRNNVSAILTKLQVTDRHAAAARAREAGLTG